jgi:hypothetical protein
MDPNLFQIAKAQLKQYVSCNAMLLEISREVAKLDRRQPIHHLLHGPSLNRL